MIRLRQQTSRDLLLEMSVDDCLRFLGELECGVPGQGLLSAEVHASALKVRSPRVLALLIVPGTMDTLIKDGDRLAWQMDPETLDELISRFRRAAVAGHFVPAELAMTQGPDGGMLRLYAEIVPT